MKKISKFIRDSNGQSLVEFALILPVLVLLVLGMIEFGWILNGKITLTSAVREGARVAAVSDISTTLKEDAAKVTVNNTVKNAAESSSLEGVSATTTFDKTAKNVTVEATGKIKPIIGLYVKGGTDGYFTLTAKAEMRIEK